jgi:cytochrome c oxidase assembly factor CtaG
LVVKLLAVLVIVFNLSSTKHYAHNLMKLSRVLEALLAYVAGPASPPRSLTSHMAEFLR